MVYIGICKVVETFKAYTGIETAYRGIYKVIKTYSGVIQAWRVYVQIYRAT